MGNRYFQLKMDHLKYMKTQTASCALLGEHQALGCLGTLLLLVVRLSSEMWLNQILRL